MTRRPVMLTVADLALLAAALALPCGLVGCEDCQACTLELVTAWGSLEGQARQEVREHVADLADRIAAVVGEHAERQA